jgi:histidinol-phosphate aminotransferase
MENKYLEGFVKESAKNIKPYVVEDREGYCLLDANENPSELHRDIIEGVLEDLKKVNRYPESGDRLKGKLAELLGNGLTKDNLILSNGADGAISLIASAFLEPGDRFLMVQPTFSMYKFYCGLAGGIAEDIPYLPGFGFPLNQVVERVSGNNPPKLLFLCSPNNPTGGTLSLSEIEEVLENANNTIVIVDQAYIEFGGESAIPLIKKYKNMVVLRTFSKALGLAGLRIGYAIGSTEIIAVLKRVLPPFLVSAMSLAIAEKALDYTDTVQTKVEEIVKERESVYERLLKVSWIEVYPSYGNFLYVKSKRDDLGKVLKEKGILVRDFGGGNLRITIGESWENTRLLEEVGKWEKE